MEIEGGDQVMPYYKLLPYSKLLHIVCNSGFQIEPYPK